MSRIFITGDTHGDLEINKLGAKQFPIGVSLSKDDYVIICGDFGLIWDNGKTDNYWLEWLSVKPFTILFIDGNHENFDLLESYPVKEWNGGKVHQIKDNIFHLMRGQIFTINNKTFFTMGGATSIDKDRRKKGISWWPQEVPSILELDEGLLNLEAHDQTVDYILTHCLPDTVNNILFKQISVPKDILTNYLDNMIAKEVNFKNWFCGHYHVDTTINKYYICYKKIYEILSDDSIIQVNK